MNGSNPFEAQYAMMEFPKGMGTNMSISGFNLNGDENRQVKLPRNLVETAKSHGLFEVVPKQDKKDK